MMERSNWVELEALYSRFLDGDQDSLLAILEDERSRLFDYLIRMTGQAHRSFESLDEVINAIMVSSSNISTLEELLIKIYATSRRFNADIWNADTSELRNLVDDRQDLAQLDHALHVLVASERELVILCWRCGFDEVAAGKIVGLPAALVNSGLERAKAQLQQSSFESSDAIQLLILSLPQHPLPGTQTSASTVAISQVIGRLRDASSNRFSRPMLWRPAWLTLFLTATAILVYLLLG